MRLLKIIVLTSLVLVLTVNLYCFATNHGGSTSFFHYLVRDLTYLKGEHFIGFRSTYHWLQSYPGFSGFIDTMNSIADTNLNGNVSDIFSLLFLIGKMLYLPISLLVDAFKQVWWVFTFIWTI